MHHKKKVYSQISVKFKTDFQETFDWNQAANKNQLQARTAIKTGPICTNEQCVDAF